MARNSGFLYNPLELGICGCHNSGKTTLITRLIEKFAAAGKRVGYAKHAPHFEMDAKGKDTWRAREAGAKLVLATDDERYALQIENGINPDWPGLASKLMLDADFVLAEGRKNTEIPKIIVLDEDDEILARTKAGKFTQVVACVGPSARTEMEGRTPCDRSGLEGRTPCDRSGLEGRTPCDRGHTGVWPSKGIPYFQRDDVDGIHDFVLKCFEERCSNRPLCGLVLTGGESRRMGKNKSELEYGGKPQLERATALLDNFCQDVFISVSHTPTLPHSHTHILPDSFIGHGPVSGILTALTARPEAAWLVLACDLPLVSEATLETLLAARNPYKFATAFRSARADFPEPLCTVYEPKSVFPLLHFLALGYDSPRNTLISTEVALVDQTDPTWLDNVNHPEEYEEIRRQLQS